jgi:hypothetical protein
VSGKKGREAIEDATDTGRAIDVAIGSRVAATLAKGLGFVADDVEKMLPLLVEVGIGGNDPAKLLLGLGHG